MNNAFQLGLPIEFDIEREAIKTDLEGTPIKAVIDEFGNKKLYISESLPFQREKHPIYLSDQEFAFVTKFAKTKSIEEEEDILAFRSIQYIVLVAKADSPDIVPNNSKDAKRGLPEYLRGYVEDERIGQYLQLLAIKKAQNTKIKREREESIDNITRSIIRLNISESRNNYDTYQTVEFEDFLNEGQLILMRCIDRYRTSDQRAFSTYYKTALEYGFLRLYNQYSRIIRLPAHWDSLKIKNQLTPEQFGIFNMARYTHEIDAPSPEDPEGENWLERVLSSNDNVESEVEAKDRNDTFKKILETVLKPRELRMLHLKHVEGYTPAQIAEKYRMHPKYVSAKIRGIEQKTKAALQEIIRKNREQGVELVL